MMNSDDDDLLCYTPLKRQKLGSGGESVRSSQPSYSQVQERYHTKLRSVNNSQLSSKSKLSSPYNTSKLSAKHNASKLSAPNNTSKLSSKLSSPNNSSKLSTLNNTSKFKTPISKAKNYSQSKESKNLLNTSISKQSIKVPSNPVLKLVCDDTSVIDWFEDKVPDIDFSKLSESGSSHSSENKDTKLSSNNEMELDLNYDLPSHSKKKNNYKNKQFNHKSVEAASDDGIEVDDNDFVNTEEPVQNSISRVDSWLQASIDQGVLTPQKVEIVNNNISPKSPPRNKDTSHDENGNPKTCVHLHFHMNSPKKSIQPTLDSYFQKSTCNLTPKTDAAIDAEGSSNKADVLKTWQSIMKSKTSGSSDVASNAKSNNAWYTSDDTKKCPFYKIVEDTSFIVDGFSYGHVSGVSAYFLSHFHADHYKGLSKKFKKPIYCSQITANLVRLKLYVEARFIRTLPMEEPRIIEGVEVTLFDSNHCPGAVMFLFKLTSGKVLLHVGDFRATPDMENISALWSHSIDVLYLDTTYLNASYDFESQDEIVEKCKTIARDHTNNNKTNKKILFVVGSYTIGKEKVFKAVASQLNCKIFVPPYKEPILRCLEDPEIVDRLTKNKNTAKVHVLPMGDINHFKLTNYLETMKPSFDLLVAIRPTGWEKNQNLESCDDLQPKIAGNVFIYGLPYSEHSSFSELKRFVKFVQAKKVIPTVNVGNKAIRNRMEGFLQTWKEESKMANHAIRNQISKKGKL